MYSLQQFQTFREGTALFWVKKNCTLALGEAMVPPIFPRKLRVPSIQESFRVGASGSPTACHEDFGADEVSKGCSYLRAQSLFSVLGSFIESAAQGTVFEDFSQGSRVNPPSTNCHSS